MALLEAILVHAGYRVGVYSTPHLLRYNERIRLNGNPVSDGVLTSSFSKIDNARGGISLSYFEFGTLAALDIFDDESVEVQILEVGLGGRLDAVNIIDADATIISSISIDHIDWLGDDREKIALEKAGVFRPKQPACCGDKTVPSSLIDYANKLDTALSLAGRDFDFKRKGQGWCLTADHALAGFYPLPSLQGQHQIQNAAACIHLLAKIQEKIPVSKKNIEYGLQHIALMGRLQQIRNSPDVFLDVAHNAESAIALARYIRKQHCTGTVHAVFSVLADKQFDQVIEPFIGLIDQWHIAPIENARSISMTDLDQFLSGKLRQNCSRYQTISQAFTGAENRLNEDDLVICFGSFYVVEACLEAL